MQKGYPQRNHHGIKLFAESDEIPLYQLLNVSNLRVLRLIPSTTKKNATLSRSCTFYHELSFGCVLFSHRSLNTSHSASYLITHFETFVRVLSNRQHRLCKHTIRILINHFHQGFVARLHYFCRHST